MMNAIEGRKLTVVPEGGDYLKIYFLSCGVKKILINQKKRDEYWNEVLDIIF